MPCHWLVKQEPSKYPFAQLQKDKTTRWDGVRNYQARNNLRAMKRGDAVLYYHSVEGKAIVGLCRVVREAYPDPTAEDGDWSVVDLQAVRAFPVPVTLDQIKDTPALRDVALLKQSRLSVMPLRPPEFRAILNMGGLSP
jgi:predicted RNA-binding protein with PUA-like domain